MTIESVQSCESTKRPPSRSGKINGDYINEDYIITTKPPRIHKFHLYPEERAGLGSEEM